MAEVWREAARAELVDVDASDLEPRIVCHSRE